MWAFGSGPVRTQHGSVMAITISNCTCTLLTTLGKKRGFGVTNAYDGLQAWSTALRNNPDAIVLDIHMPAGTGFEMLRK